METLSTKVRRVELYEVQGIGSFGAKEGELNIGQTEIERLVMS